MVADGRVNRVNRLVLWFWVVVGISVSVGPDGMLEKGLVRNLVFPNFETSLRLKDTKWLWDRNDLLNGVECNCDYVRCIIVIYLCYHFLLCAKYQFRIAFNLCVILLTKCTMWCYSFSIIIPPVRCIALSTFVVVSNQCFTQTHFSHCSTILIKTPLRISTKFVKLNLACFWIEMKHKNS